MCGANNSGQLGLPIKDCYPSPVEIKGINAIIKQVACGTLHSLILTENNEVYAVGGNSFGQLGVGNKPIMSVPIKIDDLDSVGIEKVSCGHHSAALSRKGELYIWGTSSFGVYLTPHRVASMGPHIMDVELGSCFGVALDSKNNVWAWGTNTSGELGLGDYVARRTPQMLSTLSGMNISDLFCGASCVVALASRQLEKMPRQVLTSKRRACKSDLKTHQKIPGQIHQVNKGSLSQRRGASEQSSFGKRHSDIENTERAKDEEISELERQKAQILEMEDKIRSLRAIEDENKILKEKLTVFEKGIEEYHII
jgi:alpha-tubulin suppressor-like RCC1 family protein